MPQPRTVQTRTVFSNFKMFGDAFVFFLNSFFAIDQLCKLTSDAPGHDSNAHGCVD